jgi:hypothetical protein
LIGYEEAFYGGVKLQTKYMRAILWSIGQQLVGQKKKGGLRFWTLNGLLVCYDCGGYGSSGSTKKNKHGTDWTCCAIGMTVIFFAASIVVTIGDGKTAFF